MRKLKRRAFAQNVDNSPSTKSAVNRLFSSTPSDHDKCAALYRSLNTFPNSELDFETISHALGDVAGLNFLYVAYSDGQLHELRSSVGKDLAALVEHDRQMFNKPALKQRFAVAHSTLPFTIKEEETFDLVFGASFCVSRSNDVLPSYATLLIRFQNIQEFLSPGGRFLGTCHHFDDSGGQKYQPQNSSINYRVRSLVKTAAEEAGLEGMRWIPRQLSGGQGNLGLQGDFVLLECFKS